MGYTYYVLYSGSYVSAPSTNAFSASEWLDESQKNLCERGLFSGLLVQKHIYIQLIVTVAPDTQHIIMAAPDTRSW